jgi:hypothetical protein
MASAGQRGYRLAYHRVPRLGDLLWLSIALFRAGVLAKISANGRISIHGTAGQPNGPLPPLK